MKVKKVAYLPEQYNYLTSKQMTRSTKPRTDQQTGVPVKNLIYLFLRVLTKYKHLFVQTRLFMH